MNWPDARFLRVSGARLPIVQAPMAGAGGVELAIAAIRAGAVGSLPCAMLTADQVVAQAAAVRARAVGPLNLNFFCHLMPDGADDRAWRAQLAPLYAEYGIDDPGDPPPVRRPFDAGMAAAVEAARPDLVSFHFGLPDAALVAQVRASGARIIGNATTVAEADWLAAQGCDAIIAQGFEAGGHAGFFLDGHRPVGLLSLVRQIKRAVDVPVIAAGGIVDGAAMAAALTAGASAVQVGTAYLATPESLISAPHRDLLGSATETVFTNVLTGRPARGFRNRAIDLFGPMGVDVAPFPHAASALAPLRLRSEGDFGPLWAGQGAALTREMSAGDLTARLAREAHALIGDRP